MNTARASQATMTQVPAAAERARLKDGVHIELSPRRVRAYLDKQLLADSQNVLLVYETKRPPVYWFPKAEGPLSEMPATLKSLAAFKDRVLLEQSFVKDEKQTIAQFLGDATIVAFAQVAVGG